MRYRDIAIKSQERKKKQMKENARYRAWSRGVQRVFDNKHICDESNDTLSKQSQTFRFYLQIKRITSVLSSRKISFRFLSTRNTVPFTKYACCRISVALDNNLRLDKCTVYMYTYTCINIYIFHNLQIISFGEQGMYRMNVERDT